jgi:hypothetical protein
MAGRPVKGKQIELASITQGHLNLATPSSAGDAARKDYVDSAISTLQTSLTNSILSKDWKDSVRVASTANVTVSSPGTAIDGVTLTNGDRVLLKNQSTGSENGIYVFNGSGSAMTRATDFNSSTNVTTGAATLVEEGSTNAGTAWRLSTTGAITVGTTSLSFTAFSTITAPVPTTSNKAMTASVTSSDFDEACATAIASTPAQSSFVAVLVNGILAELGNGVKTKDCYFSGNSGTTARAHNAVVSGDKLYWVGSVAGYQLATTDRIDFVYVV